MRLWRYVPTWTQDNLLYFVNTKWLEKISVIHNKTFMINDIYNILIGAPVRMIEQYNNDYY